MFHLLLFLLLSATAFAQHEAPRTMFVTYGNAPLYDSASYMSTILARLSIGDSVIVIGRRGTFAQVTAGDRKGYLLLSNIGATPPKRSGRATAKSAQMPKDSSETASEHASRSSRSRNGTSGADAPRAQCKAITRSGKQCTRMASDSSGYCWQHRRN